MATDKILDDLNPIHLMWLISNLSAVQGYIATVSHIMISVTKLDPVYNTVQQQVWQLTNSKGLPYFSTPILHGSPLLLKILTDLLQKIVGFVNLFGSRQ